MPANRICTAVLLLFGLTSVGIACETGPDALRMKSESGAGPEVFVIPEPPVVSQPTGLSLIVCSQDVEEISDLVVDAWMPAHQHGMNYDPDIEVLSDGRFAISNMVYHMLGLWQLTVALRAGEERWSYVLDMPIK